MFSGLLPFYYTSFNLSLEMSDEPYIAKSLVARGTKESQIHIKNFGGIDKYEANEANRFTIVILSN